MGRKSFVLKLSWSRKLFSVRFSSPSLAFILGLILFIYYNSLADMIIDVYWKICCCWWWWYLYEFDAYHEYCLVGQVVKASAPKVESRLQQDFSGSSHTSDLNIGTPVATLPGAWRCRVNAGTGWPSVSILWLSEVENLICKLLSQCGSTYYGRSRSVREIP